MTDYISRADALNLVYDGSWATSEGLVDRINALPSAELPNGDLISRADAIEAVCDGCVWYKTASCEEGKEEWECSEVNKIRHLPSADAEQGEWQKVEEQPYFRKHYDTVCCSVCRKKGNRKWKFCPNCGAKMKGADDE